jgi:hypothetical protein
MIEIKFRGDFAEFKIAEIDEYIITNLTNNPPTPSDIHSILRSTKHKTYRGFKINTDVIYENDIHKIGELDNVYYGLKRIPIKNKSILFYGTAWKDKLMREVDFNEGLSINDLPFEVTEYRFSNKVRFELINIPKTIKINQSDNLVIENAAIQYPNNHLIELISVRNDH